MGYKPDGDPKYYPPHHSLLTVSVAHGGLRVGRGEGGRLRVGRGEGEGRRGRGAGVGGWGCSTYCCISSVFHLVLLSDENVVFVEKELLKEVPGKS